MIFTRPAHRKIVSAPPAGGKPTAAFQPNTGYENFPTLSALYFTNLISGQTAYTEDSVAGRADFINNAGTGDFGQFAKGEGYEVVVRSSGFGGYNNATIVGTGSFAMLCEFTMTRVSTSYIYLIGYGTGAAYCIGPRNANYGCAQEGIYWTGSPYCLGSIGDGELHRVALKHIRSSGGASMSIALDGVMLYDAVAQDYNRGATPFSIGMKTHGRSETVFATGAWEWTTPFDGADPLPDAAMIELSADPWPHLAVLD